MEEKQKAISEAYGEHWEFFKDNVNSDGWIKDRDFWGRWPKEMDIKWQTTDHDNDYYDTRRPLTLKGIENNNGWIKVESEHDLPKEDNLEKYNCGILDADGKFKKMETNVSFIRLTRLKNYFTHYQPMQIPNPPIY